MSACEQGTVAIVDCIQKRETLAFWSESHSNLWIWKYLNIESWNEFGLPYPSFIFQVNAGMVRYSFWPRCLMRPTWPPSGLQWAVANDAGSKLCKSCMICSMEESSWLTMLTGAVGAANELFGFQCCVGRKALLVKRDVEYKHLDATVQNIPECFFQILHTTVVGRTSAKPYCLQCCHCCLRKRQRVYCEVAKKKQREIADFRVENFKKDTTVAPACKWTTMNMLIPTKCCTLLLIHIREIYGNLSSITRGVSAAAGEQWQRALHLLKECIEGKDCLSVATQHHTYGKGREGTGTSEQASQGHNWLKHCWVM